jgi:hypothetical protein
MSQAGQVTQPLNPAYYPMQPLIFVAAPSRRGPRRQHGDGVRPKFGTSKCSRSIQHSGADEYRAALVELQRAVGGASAQYALSAGSCCGSIGQKRDVVFNQERVCTAATMATATAIKQSRVRLDLISSCRDQQHVDSPFADFLTCVPCLAQLWGDLNALPAPGAGCTKTFFTNRSCNLRQNT